MNSWVKSNVVALATWFGVLLSLVAAGAANIALAENTQKDLAQKVAIHEEDIVRLESDVRSIREQQARLVKIAEKTETVLSDLSQTTAELKVMVQTIKD
tara:strand:+ start:252 stop:548 length:297 start_codon:yes stop_codon:yes gene_type:complete